MIAVARQLAPAYPEATTVASRFESQAAAVIAAAVEARVAATDPARLQPAAAAGVVDGIVLLLGLPILASAVSRNLQPVLQGAFLAGVELGAEPLVGLGVAVRRAGGVLAKRDTAISVDLQALNPDAVAWAEAHAANALVAPRKVRQAVRELVAAAQRHQVPVRILARQLRAVIGLDVRRARALQSFTVRLIGEGVSEAEVLRRTERYAQALRRQRALVVARTEAASAVSGGQDALWRLAAKRGVIGASLVKTWLVTPDEILCPRCERLDGTTAEIAGTFPNGKSSPPDHPNCRCAHALVPRPRL